MRRMIEDKNRGGEEEGDRNVVLGMKMSSFGYLQTTPVVSIWLGPWMVVLPRWLVCL